MRNTLIVYEGNYGTSKKISEIFSYILSMSKIFDILHAPKEIDDYNNLILVFEFNEDNMAKSSIQYLNELKQQLYNIKIGIIGIRNSKGNINNCISDITKLIQNSEKLIAFIDEEFDKKVVITLAEHFLNEFNLPDKKMERYLLKQEIDKFILNHNTCALATGIDTFIRCTPIEYIYYKDNFYILSEGGLKFKGIIQNPNVCIVIFNNYEGMNKLLGMQVMGKASIITLWSDEYIEVVKTKGLNPDKLKNLKINLNLIKINPQSFEFLNSDFNKKSVDTKQYYN